MKKTVRLVRMSRHSSPRKQSQSGKLSCRLPFVIKITRKSLTCGDLINEGRQIISKYFLFTVDKCEARGNECRALKIRKNKSRFETFRPNVRKLNFLGQFEFRRVSV